MPHDVFTASWAAAWGERINASDAYKEAARKWEWPMVLLLRADAALGVPEERGVFLDLWRGECRAARTATREEAETVPYVLGAGLATWKQVLDGKLEPIPGLMRGKLKLVRGSLASLLPFVAASKELVRAATEVETRFPEELLRLPAGGA